MLTEKWKKSTRSGEGGDCVEARLDGTVQVRDTKDRKGGQLGFDPADWKSFVAQVQAGEFDR